MIYVIVEIFGLTQLHRLKKDFINIIINNIDTAFSVYKKGPVEEEDDLLVYSLGSPKKEHNKILDALFSGYKYLLNSKEELQGFNVFVENYEDTSEKDILKIMQKKLYSLQKEDRLWLGNSCFDLLGQNFNVKENEGIREVLSRNEELQHIPGGVYRIFNRPKAVEEIIGALIPEIGKETEKKIILLYSSPYVGKEYNLNRALSIIKGDNQVVEWLRICSPDINCQDPLNPFLKGISSSFCKKVPLFLSNLEKAVWEQIKDIFSGSCSDHRFTDFVIWYRLYLFAYIRHTEEQMLPPVIVCENIDSYSKKTTAVITRIFNEIIPLTPIIPVYLSVNPEPIPGLETIRHLKMKIPALGVSKIGQLVNNIPGLNGEEEKLKSISKGEDIKLFHYIYLAQRGVDIDNAADFQDVSVKAALILEYDYKVVLYAIILTQGTLNRTEINELLLSTGFSKIKIEAAFLELEDNGFISGILYPKSIIPEIKEPLFNDISINMKKLNRAMIEYVWSLWKNGKIECTERILYLFSEYGDMKKLLKLFNTYVSNKLDEGDVKEAESCLERYNFLLKKQFSKKEYEDVKKVFFSLDIRKRLINGNAEETSSLLIKWDELFFVCDPEIAAEYFLEGSRYYCAIYEFRKALDLAKRSLILIQSTDNRLIESNAYIELGLIMLGMQKIEEANDYFVIASESAKSSVNSFIYIRAAAYEALCLFIYGNHSKALRLLDEILPCSERAGRRDWQLYLLLLKGKILFELGLYSDAGEAFQNGLTLCKLYSHKEREKVFYSWLARTFIYSGMPDYALKILGAQEQDMEALFFTAEAFFMYGDSEKALKALEFALMKNNNSILFNPGEFLDWNNGFASFEDRALKSTEGTGVLLQLVRAFKGYLLGLKDKKQEGLLELTQVAREEKLSEIDPYNRLYYYFYTMILSAKEGTDALNRLTLLSKALKYLQELAARIDDPKLKQAYIKKNYWNYSLFSEASKYKLI